MVDDDRAAFPALPELTIADVGAGLTAGAFTAAALTQACLDHIALHDSYYNAVITLEPNALANAAAIDRRRAAGEPLGPLAGVPLVIKDTIDAAGLPTTGGWKLLSARAGGIDVIPASDAPVVARLRAAGAVILGKTNVPILSASGSHANDSWAGPTRNAVDAALLPGGSSAGTATAVAAGFAVAGLGEETSGSIQNPASAQALVGITPSVGLVPNAGALPMASLRDVLGPIARCVRDAAVLLDVIAGFTTADPKTLAAIGHLPSGGFAAGLRSDALTGRRIGLYGPGWRDQPLADEVTAQYRRVQAELTARGAVLVDDPFAGSGFAEIGRAFQGPGLFDPRGLESAPHDLDRYFARLGPAAAIRDFAGFAAATASADAFAPSGVLGFLNDLPQFAACHADPTAPPDLSDFVAVRTAYLRIFAEVFARQRLDALVFPQMREVLTALHGPDEIKETTAGEINVAGLPGVTVPAGYHAKGAPFGIIFVGPQWSEAALLGMAYDYETATRHRRAPVLSAA